MPTSVLFDAETISPVLPADVCPTYAAPSAPPLAPVEVEVYAMVIDAGDEGVLKAAPMAWLKKAINIVWSTVVVIDGAIDVAALALACSAESSMGVVAFTPLKAVMAPTEKTFPDKSKA